MEQIIGMFRDLWDFGNHIRVYEIEKQRDS